MGERIGANPDLIRRRQVVDILTIPGRDPVVAEPPEIRRSRRNHPILTEIQEKILFTRLRQGQNTIDAVIDDPEFLAEIPESTSARARWLYVLTTNDTLRELAAACNFRMVKTIASKYRKILELSSGISAGEEGLVRAIDKFDPQKGRFSTYAPWWIRESIQGAIQEKYEISDTTYTALGQVRKIKKAFVALYGTLPTRAELEAQLWTNTNLSGNQIAIILTMPAEISYLTTPFIRKGEDGESLDFDLPDSTSPPLEDQVLDRATETVIYTVMDKRLDERDRAIVVAYFGLEGNDEQILDKIAQDHEISRTRVGQLLKRALNILRHDSELASSEVSQGRTRVSEELVERSGDGSLSIRLSRRQISAMRERFRSDQTEAVRAYIENLEQKNNQKFAGKSPAKGRRPATIAFDNQVKELKLAGGLSYKEMAEKLGTNVKQISNAVSRLYNLGEIS